MGRLGREIQEKDAIASEGEESPDVLNVLERNVAESSASKACEAEEVLKLQQEALLLMKPKVAKAHQLGGALKKRKLVKKRVPREYIDLIMARPYKGIDEIPEESLAKSTQEFREWYATEKAISDKISEYEQALINHFLTKGYVETLAGVTDDEDDN
ncbi:unnamed protein product [Urochloa humidicola]